MASNEMNNNIEKGMMEIIHELNFLQDVQELYYYISRFPKELPSMEIYISHKPQSTYNWNAGYYFSHVIQSKFKVKYDKTPEDRLKNELKDYIEKSTIGRLKSIVQVIFTEPTTNQTHSLHNERSEGWYKLDWNGYEFQDKAPKTGTKRKLKKSSTNKTAVTKKIRKLKKFGDMVDGDCDNFALSEDYDDEENTMSINVEDGEGKQKHVQSFFTSLELEPKKYEQPQQH